MSIASKMSNYRKISTTTVDLTSVYHQVSNNNYCTAPLEISSFVLRFCSLLILILLACLLIRAAILYNMVSLILFTQTLNLSVGRQISRVLQTCCKVTYLHTKTYELSTKFRQQKFLVCLWNFEIPGGENWKYKTKYTLQK